MNMKRRHFLLGSGSILSSASLLGSGPLLSGAAALLATACVSKPQMQLHHAEIRAANLMGIQMEVYFNVFNDNGFDVQVRNVRVNTVLQKKYPMPYLEYSPNTWLPAHRTVIVTAPTLIPWHLVPNLLMETASRPSISYRVKGSADVTATSSLKVKSDNYPVDEEGTIPRAAILQAAQFKFPGVHWG